MNMKIEKITKLKLRLEETEYYFLEEAIKVLEKIEEAMIENDCEFILCDGEFPRESSELLDAIHLLEDFKDITEITS